MSEENLQQEEMQEQEQQQQPQDEQPDGQQGEQQEEQANEHTQNDEQQAELLRQIAELTRQSEENYNRFLRAHADLENYRKRVAKEKEELLKYGSARIVEALLPILDNFERAIAAGRENNGENDPLVQGIEMIFRQIQQVLAQENVKPIEAVGKPFDPNYHQAVMQVESDEFSSGMVVEELQKGYMLHERVIRPSMVKVSS